MNKNKISDEALNLIKQFLERKKSIQKDIKNGVSYKIIEGRYNIKFTMAC